MVNVEHPADRDLETLTAEHRQILLPALVALRDGSERVVCDLGCGAGRFTADFAAVIRGRAIGVEADVVVTVTPADWRRHRI